MSKGRKPRRSKAARQAKRTRRQNRRRPPTRPPRPPRLADPALVTTQAALRRINRHILSFNFTAGPDPTASFQELCRLGLADLDAYPIGNGQHLSDAHMNADKASHYTRTALEHFQEHIGEDGNIRTQNAGWLIVMAGQFVDAAVLPYMKDKRFYNVPTLVLLRSALECAARGGFIALGRRDEASVYQRGTNATAQSCFDRVRAAVLRRRPSATTPDVVYGWLSDATHLNVNMFLHPPSREDAYAAIAYVAWFTAAMAELVTGERLAEWPSVWPSHLPWDGASQANS